MRTSKLQDYKLQVNEVLAHPDDSGGLFSFCIESSEHRFIVDEPVDSGGDNLGMGPFDLLASSLAACTAMTLKYYAQHKKIDWGLFNVTVQARTTKNPESGEAVLELVRNIYFEDALSDDLVYKATEIANKCPVHRALTGKIQLVTESFAGTLTPPAT